MYTFFQELYFKVTVLLIFQRKFQDQNNCKIAWADGKNQTCSAQKPSQTMMFHPSANKQQVFFLHDLF